MKVIAAILADFGQTVLGTASRLTEELAGETVLRRTLKRVRAARRLASIHLAVRKQDKPAAGAAAQGLGVRIDMHDAGNVPWRSLITSARKWSLDGWRGGLAGATVFDECLHPWVLAALGAREKADAVVAVPADAVLLDPDLLDRMIEHFAKTAEEVRLVFTQTAPGLSAAIYQTQFLKDLSEAGHPFCRVMAYRPDDPLRDMAHQPCFFPVDSTITNAAGRCLADTQAAMRRLSRLIHEAGDGNGASALDAVAVSRWLTSHRHDEVSEMPAEVEIELTTADPLATTNLRPRGRAVGERGPLPAEVVRRLASELATRDDARIVLGGFGDPLMHPEFGRIVRGCREAGVFGIAIRTPLVELADDQLAAILEARVDVLNVLLDAMTAETYRRVHGADRFAQVQANIDRVCRSLHEAGQPQPLIVCEMAKTHETLDEMEEFHAHWTRRTGHAVVAGPSHHGRQWADLSVMRIAPPTRFPCSRLFDRMMILADGRVAVCDQDFAGRHVIGNTAETSLSQIWTGDVMRAVRESHLDGRYDGAALCRACDEWHRF